MKLQENKAINLSLVAPKINNILIKPGETFSFFKLSGDFKKRQGFKEGLIIKGGVNPIVILEVECANLQIYCIG